MSEPKRDCQNCKHCGMDMDLDPYCAHPSLMPRYPYGKSLTKPIPGCPIDTHPLFEPRERKP